MHALSLWAATSNKRNVKPSLQGEVETDVVIIGGGYTGLSTAYHLLQKGIKAVVLEQHEVGWGASGRNAGMILPGYQDSMSTIAKRYGIPAAKDMFSFSLEGIRLVESIIKERNISCDFKRSGHFVAAYKLKHLDALKKEQEFLNVHANYKTEVIDKMRMPEELDSTLYQGGLVDSQSCSFHPLNYALGLAHSVEDLGGVIYEHSQVIDIAHFPKHVIVRTASGSVKANQIVIATNGYTDGLIKKLTRSVFPIASYMIATEPLPPKLAKKLIPKNRMIFDTKNFLYYFRLTTDSRLVFGGKDSLHGVESEQTYAEVREELLEVFPELADYAIDYKWGGLLGMTSDFFPHIGQLDNGTHFALGCAGHGAAITTLLGKVMAQNIVHEDRVKSRLETLPLKEIPFHGQRALIMNVVEWYYKLLDKIS
ncbi:FAD-binding oxidoreductase [Peribacillus muralis]|uniref:NAD(P)/FAD-dependent oxidoreductase n=1 Tax=Peribacillus muralis TaxID=264697 RepID=UPI001F4D9C17|nr:FAD-binding oxidoreductase [Peribacillus muralis]MCK1992940.1 FAD-binding oxidoreductase [Peribacillus muralis]MCK2013495.1 FAD-binding oxidoreductase [Peribacillus muralis]